MKKYYPFLPLIGYFIVLYYFIFKHIRENPVYNLSHNKFLLALSIQCISIVFTFYIFNK